MNIHISQRSVEKQEAPAKGNRVLYDDKIAGFGIRVTAAGAKSFVLNYRINGRKRLYTIGSWPDQFSADVARAEAEELRSKIKKGNDPLGEKEFARGEPTMAELAKQYTDEHLVKHKSGKSIYEDQRMLNKIIAPKQRHAARVGGRDGRREKAAQLS
jgi:hypothetical protein